MSGLLSLHGQIANGRSKMFRRCFIKRRLLGTGLYETDWVEVTEDIVKWGSIKKEVDAGKVNSFKFSSTKLTFSNRLGRYNPSDDENSLWSGYGDQQRTLVKIRAGFVYEQRDSSGVWGHAEMPSDAIWDVSMWDSGQWDSATNVLFTGIISGDISLDGSDQVSIPVAPMTEAFRLFAAPRLTGYGPSLTASTFLEVVRDQVDANGVYIFRPFFGDTTTSWVINTTTVNYANLNTSTAADVKDATVWGLIEKLAVSENFVPYVGNDGSFNFVARDYNNTASSFHFIGSGGFSSEYGQTIKKVSWFGKRFSKYYSRVRLKFRGEDTTTSFAIEDSIYEVRGSSGPWTLGEKTLDIQNLWIPTLTVAETIAQELFDEYSAIRTEVEFTTSLVPQLDLLDRVQITYDPTNNSQNSLWDAYDWGDDLAINGATEMLWDSSGGDALKMVAREFRLISIDVNLDSGECKFIGRE